MGWGSSTTAEGSDFYVICSPFLKEMITVDINGNLM